MKVSDSSLHTIRCILSSPLDLFWSENGFQEGEIGWRYGMMEMLNLEEMKLTDIWNKYEQDLNSLLIYSFKKKKATE